MTRASAAKNPQSPPDLPPSSPPSETSSSLLTSFSETVARLHGLSQRWRAMNIGDDSLGLQTRWRSARQSLESLRALSVP